MTHGHEALLLCAGASIPTHCALIPKPRGLHCGEAWQISAMLHGFVCPEGEVRTRGGEDETFNETGETLVAVDSVVAQVFSSTIQVIRHINALLRWAGVS